MPDFNLVNFIRQGLATGRSREELVQALLAKGWGTREVEEAFRRLDIEGAGNAEPQVSTLPITEKRLAALEGNIDQLRHVVGEYAERIRLLERREATAPQPEFEKAGPRPGALPPPPPPPLYQPGAQEPPRQPSIHWEAVFGGNWFARIGALAIIVGLGFFLALAIQNKWIGPQGQIFLGIASGLLMLSAGEYWRVRYSRYAQALTGGGIGALYLSIFAAFAFYEFISAWTAFGAMGVVTAASALLAVRYNAVAIAALGILGGFVTPVLLFKDLGAPLILFGYVALLDVGVLVISRFRNWRPLMLLGLVGTASMMALGYATYYKEERLWVFELFLTLYFLIFVAATFFAQLLEKKKTTRDDVGLMALNAAHYFIWSWILLRSDYEMWLGFFAAFLGGFYVLLASFAFPRRGEDRALMLVLGGLALVFLTIAVPLQVSDRWITIAWAAEGLVLIWLGFSLKEVALRFSGLALFVITAIRLVFFDTAVNAATFTPLLNGRFATFLIAIAAFAGASWLYAKGRSQLRPDEERVGVILRAAANIVALWMLSAEVISYFDHRIAQVGEAARAAPRILPPGLPKADSYEDIKGLRSAMNLGLSVLWMCYAIGALISGIAFRSREIRIGGVLLFMLVIVKVFLYDSSALSEGFRVASFLILGVILLAAGFLYQRYRAEIRGFLADEDSHATA